MTMLKVIEHFVKKLRPRVSAIKKEFVLDLELLPKCRSKIVIASPKYHNSLFACEVTVDVKDLLPWAERHAKNAWCPDSEQQASRLALPVWLRNADLSCDEPSYLPAKMYDVVDPYVHNFTSTDSTQVTCLECGSIVKDLKQEKYNEMNLCSWRIYTTEWHCEKGHQLYYQDHEIHFFIKKDI